MLDDEIDDQRKTDLGSIVCFHIVCLNRGNFDRCYTEKGLDGFPNCKYLLEHEQYHKNRKL